MLLSAQSVAVLAAAGVAAAALNAIVGGGALITYLTLTAFGIPPLTAGVTSSIALLPGSAAGAWAGRGDIPAWRAPAALAAGIALAGGAEGAVLAMILPPGTFTAAIPWLVGAATLLVLAGGLPWHHRRHLPAGGYRPWIGPAAMAAGVYGGYFSAAQGVILLAVLEGAWPGLSTPQLIAVKNLTATAVLAAAAVVFAFMAAPQWTAAAVIGSAGLAGGRSGARIGARLPSWALRAAVAAVGSAAIVHAVT